MKLRRKPGSFLEWHSGSLRVVVSVPKALQSDLGTKLKRGLGTDSLALAETRKWSVVADLKRRIEEAKRGASDPLKREAAMWKQELSRARLPDGPDDEDERGLVSSLLMERAEQVQSSEGLARARTLVDLATGSATLIDSHLDAFLGEQTYSVRYKDDVRRALGRLQSWCVKTGIPETIEAITRRVAGRFVTTELAVVLGSRKSVNKEVSAIKTYWGWLIKRGLTDEAVVNPWQGQSFEVTKRRGMEDDGGERAFTPSEAAVLLHGPASKRLADVMWIAAFSGLRIDEVCRLQVRDCEGGWFKVNARRAQTGEGKTDASRRDVPIHSALVERLLRMVAGKAGADLLIDGLPPPDPSGRRRPSAAVGQEFTRYRRARGVDDLVSGKRRSLVNFHSWRRWFVTSALRADQPLHLVSWVVGHEEGRKSSMTLTYDRSGPSADQMRAVVESVVVPAPPT